MRARHCAGDVWKGTTGIQVRLGSQGLRLGIRLPYQSMPKSGSILRTIAPPCCPRSTGTLFHGHYTRPNAKKSQTSIARRGKQFQPHSSILAALAAGRAAVFTSRLLKCLSSARNFGLARVRHPLAVSEKPLVTRFRRSEIQTSRAKKQYFSSLLGLKVQFAKQHPANLLDRERTYAQEKAKTGLSRSVDYPKAQRWSCTTPRQNMLTKLSILPIL